VAPQRRQFVRDANPMTDQRADHREGRPDEIVMVGRWPSAAHSHTTDVAM